METAAARIITVKRPENAGGIVSKDETPGGLHELHNHLSYVPDYFDKIQAHSRVHSVARLIRDASRCDQMSP